MLSRLPKLSTQIRDASTSSAGSAAGMAALIQQDAAVNATAAAVSSARKEFYKRELPAGCIPFESAEGKALFAEALRDGTMECYFPLAAQFRTQDEPAFCGLSTLVMTLNALRIDPRRLWKGPWRWFTEDMLDCCRPVEVVKEKGVDLDTFACLARCNSAATDVHRAWPPPGVDPDRPSDNDAPLHDPGEDEFRQAVKRAARIGEGEYLVLSYSRKGLGQTGDGHFSPLGGYHAGRDMVLILDVARFKYPPHWVPVSVLWRAMQRTDPETNMPRGYVWLRRLASAPLLLFHIPAVASIGDGAAEPSGTGVCLNKRLNTSLEAGLSAGRAALLATSSSTRAPPSLLSSPSGSDCNISAESSSNKSSGSGCGRCAEKELLGRAVYQFVDAFEAATRNVAADASSSSMPANAAGGASFGRVFNGQNADGGSSSPIEAGCVDKLSPEHIEAASALIVELESTPLYPHVVKALKRIRKAEEAAAVEADIEDCADPSHHHHHHVHPTSDDAALILTSSTSPSTTAAVTAAVRAGESLGQSSPKEAEAAVRAVCETHGLTCIRVKKAHVLTVSDVNKVRLGN